LPISTKLPPLDRLIRTAVVSPVTFFEIRRHLHALRETRAFRHPELIDARGARGDQFTARDVVSIAGFARRTLGHPGTAARALVVGSDEDFGRSRLLAGLVAGWVRVAVFRDLGEAERWLDEQRTWALPAGAASEEERRSRHPGNRFR
jgi:hypothetical protein